MSTKKRLKNLDKLHHPMWWPNHNNDAVCAECRVPYPCKSASYINSPKKIKKILCGGSTTISPKTGL